MNKEIFLRYKGKNIKLTQFPNFVLDGVIVAVFDDCIEFETSTASSIIDFRAVKAIREINNDY